MTYRHNDLSYTRIAKHNRTQRYTDHISMLHIWSKDAYPTLTSNFCICISSSVSVSVSAQSSAWSALARHDAYPSPATSSEANAFNKLSSWMPSFEIWPWTQISVLGRAKLYTVYIWYIILCMYRLVYRVVYLCQIVSHCLRVCDFNNLLTVVYLCAAMRYECRTWIRLLRRRLRLLTVFPLGCPCWLGFKNSLGKCVSS